jgi:hypothetical protein
MWSRRAAVMSWLQPGRAAEIQSIPVPLVGEGEDVQPWRWCLPEWFGRFAAPVRRRVGMRVPSSRTTSPPRLAIFFNRHR